MHSKPRSGPPIYHLNNLGHTCRCLKKSYLNGTSWLSIRSSSLSLPLYQETAAFLPHQAATDHTKEAVFCEPDYRTYVATFFQVHLSLDLWFYPYTVLKIHF